MVPYETLKLKKTCMSIVAQIDEGLRSINEHTFNFTLSKILFWTKWIQLLSIPSKHKSTYTFKCLKVSYTCCKVWEMVSRVHLFKMFLLSQCINNVLPREMLNWSLFWKSNSVWQKILRQTVLQTDVQHFTALQRQTCCTERVSQKCSHCLIFAERDFAWLWLFDKAMVRLSKLYVQTSCARVASGECDKVAVYGHWQHFVLIIILFGQWNILVYKTDKKHQLIWNESSASHQQFCLNFSSRQGYIVDISCFFQIF